MALSSSKHFMEWELAMEVPLYDIHPLRISWLEVQFLKQFSSHSNILRYNVFKCSFIKYMF